MLEGDLHHDCKADVAGGQSGGPFRGIYLRLADLAERAIMAHNGRPITSLLAAAFGGTADIFIDNQNRPVVTLTRHFDVFSTLSNNASIAIAATSINAPKSIAAPSQPVLSTRAPAISGAATTKP